MKKKPDRKCNCDAIVWCHIDGYSIKPRPVNTYENEGKGHL